MQSKIENIIVGYGGHSLSVIDSLIKSGGEISYYSDKKQIEYNPYGLKYLGYEGDIEFSGWNLELNFILGIGNNKLRESIGQKIISHSKKLINVIDPNSSISVLSDFGQGVFVSSGVCVSAFSKIGDFVILNTGSIIEHNSILGSGTSVSPGAVICGNVEIGERVLIGANSVIKEGIKIGHDSIIGAGSVIIRDVEPKSTVVGNPGKKI